MDLKDLNGLRTIEEVDAYIVELRDRIVEIANPERSAELTPEERGELVECRDAKKAAEERRDEMQTRLDLVDEMRGEAGATENPQRELRRKSTTARNHDVDIYDLSTVAFANDGGRELRDRAMKAIEHNSRSLDEDQQTHLAGLVEDLGPQAARRIVATGSPVYQRAFIKTVAGKPLTVEEQRALSVYGSSEDGTEGNLAVPFTLDPTMIATGDVSLNPIRRVASVSQITGNTWKGVAADAIAASYGAEGSPASDGAPTFAQPEIHVEEAKAFVPYSRAIGEDYANLQSDLGQLLLEAKDLLEGDKFLTGAGHGSEEPEGILTGLTGSQEVPASTSFDVTDLYALSGALPRRHKSRASYLAHETILNLVRGFATTGTNIWVESLQDDQPSRLLGKAVYQCDEMDDEFSAGKTVMILGNWSRYKIVDRIGMSVEVIPNLFDTSTGYPTGTRGLFAMWRNSAGVLDVNAFRVLVYGS